MKRPFIPAVRRVIGPVLLTVPLLSDLHGAEIRVDAGDVKNICSPFLYGSCLEDLNHEVYGGLYDQRLYGESFEEPAKPLAIRGWESYAGQWQVVDGVVSVPAHYGAKLVRSEPQFSDGTVEFDVRFPISLTPYDTAGVILRVQNPGIGADVFNGYEISLASDGKNLVLGRHQQNWLPLQNVAVSVDASQWQRIKVVLTGGRIQIYMNEGANPVIDFVDPNPLPAGKVGLRTWNSSANFRNLKTVSGGVETNNDFAVGTIPARIVDWLDTGGQWQPIESGNGVSVQANLGAKLVRQKPQFTDGTVDFDVCFAAPFSSTVNAGGIIRARNVSMGGNTLEGYDVNLSSDGKKITLAKLASATELRSAAISVDPAAWQHVSVVLQGARVRVYLNGAADPVIDFVDPDPRPLGNVGLKTWGANASFRNFKTTATEGVRTSVFKGVPAYDISSVWDPVQTGTAQVSYFLDSDNPYNSQKSQKVEFIGGVGAAGVANQGLNHWGIALKQGHTYPGRVYLRSTGMQGNVTVSLQSADGSQTYASQVLSNVTSGWAKFPFELTSTADDSNARLAITLDAPGTVWIDQAVLLGPPDARYEGVPVRADIADAVKAGGVKFMRYGGSAVNSPNYRWKDMIGDRDRRPQYNGTWHNYTSNGFGIEEFVAFCRSTGVEPAFAINVEETPQDMADMVEYLNGDESTYWGGIRAANGRREPYGVRFIELGNEEMIWGDISADFDHYIERFKLLAAAMKKVDPNLKLVNSAWWYGDTPNSEKTFKALEGIADYWDFHFWTDEPTVLPLIKDTLTDAKRLFQEWVPGAKMKVVIFEENGERHDLQRGLVHARVLNEVRRHGDFVLVDCEANALQAWFQNDNGWDQGHVFFTPDKVWGMPNYHVQQMLSDNHLPLLVSSEVINGSSLDVTATKSEDGKTVCVHVVNYSPSPSTSTLVLNRFTPASSNGQVWTISSGNRNDVNPVDNTTAVVPVSSTVTASNGSFSWNFPANSYTVLRFSAAQASSLETRASEYALSLGVTGEAAASSADPDGDGMDNFAEWAFGTNPSISDASLANVTLSSKEGGLRFHHRRLRNYGQSGVSYLYQISDDLNEWRNIIPEEVSSTRIVSHPEYEDSEFQLPASEMEGRERLFLRIVVPH